MKFISKTISFLSLFLLFSSCFAQETISYNNEQYFVYPHKKKSTFSWAFIVGVNIKNSKNKEILFRENYSTEIPLEPEEIELARLEFDRTLKDAISKTNKRQKAYIRQNSDKYYMTYSGKYTTLTPSLDPLPDGKYVQLFDHYYRMDQKGDLQADSSKIAGFFTLKNNLAEGFAYWINEKGDTIEKGNFVAGQRDGRWEFKSIESFDFAEDKMNLPIEPNKIICSYQDGLQNGSYEEYVGKELTGKGFYKNDKAAGEWFEYQYDQFQDHYFLHKHYTYADKKSTSISKKPIIRKQLFDFQESDADTFKLHILDYEFPYYMSFLYEYNFVEQEDYELPEEKYGSYEGGSQMPSETEYYGDEEGNLYESTVLYEGKSYDMTKLIDSIGVTFLYKDVYEIFWQNGKIQFRFKFTDGELEVEDTLFWDNGLPANIVSFDPEKNHYSVTDYDLQGLIIRSQEYDSVGKFLSREEGFKEKIDTIGGLPARYNVFLYQQDLNYYSYNNDDTLLTPLTNPVTIFKSWYRDKSTCGDVRFDPNSRELTVVVNSINGYSKLNSSFSFAENYSYYSSRSVQRFKDLSTETVSNGNLRNGIIPDSIPQRHVKKMYELFTATSDHTFLYKNVPFTGDFAMTFDEAKQKLSFSQKSIKLSLGGTRFQEKLKKDMLNYFKKKRVKNKDLLYLMDLGFDYEAGFLALFPQLNDLFYNAGNQFDGQAIFSEMKQIKGRFENGRPVGKWLSLDSEGKIKSEFNFENGELNGEVKHYAFALPQDQNVDPATLALYDFPDKKTYYLSSTRKYNKGILNGEEKHFDWSGKVIYSASYKDGFLDGTAIERNKIFTSQTGYEDGLYDGIMQTKLSLPGKDTILLYDINFQNHQLQGESRSYHTNGKLAKRGFFLNNEPIEDYEAYDSLGTKYHYIKFLYSYPVEEKIWEENELSVKYEYDWHDSIYFRPNDLIEIPAVYDLLYTYNLIDDSYYDAPYFGRSSLIDKTGISYRVSKFYPNEILAREGTITKGKKTGFWKYYDLNGKKLYEIEYFDTILHLSDSIHFKSKGMYYDYNTSDGTLASKSYVIEKIENYDCSHTDHYENRQFYTIWMAPDGKQDRMNGYAKNYYDNGTLQSEGNMANGLPTGVWKFYTPNGMLNQVGTYVMGKRHGRWLSGDLSKTNYLGDICMNPNAPDIEERIRYQENILDIQIRYFKLGKIQKTEQFDLNLNK